MSKKSLSKENIFLLSLISDKSLQINENSSANSKLNWKYLLNISLKYGISPVFYQKLKNTSLKTQIPEDIFLKFKHSYLHTFSSNLKRYNEISSFLTELQNNKIRAILLKGGALAEIIYQDIGLRMMTDIDILVKVEDIEQAEKILKSLGFLQTTIYSSKLSHKLKLHHQISYKKNNLMIELHWNILASHHRFEVNINEFIENSKEISIQNKKSYIFSPENLLQHLSLHFSHHINTKEFRLSWLLDIYKVLQFYKEKIDWKYLYENSKKYGFAQIIFENLYLANKYLDAPVEKSFFNHFTQNSINFTFEENFLYFLYEPNKKLKLTANFSYLKKIKKIKGTHYKILYLWQELFPQKKFLKNQYKIENNFLFLIIIWFIL